MSWENHLKIQENKLSGKLIPWIIMSMEKCLTGGKNGRIKYLEEKIREINVVQPVSALPAPQLLYSRSNATAFPQF